MILTFPVPTFEGLLLLFSVLDSDLPILLDPCLSFPSEFLLDPDLCPPFPSGSLLDLDLDLCLLFPSGSLLDLESSVSSVSVSSVCPGWMPLLLLSARSASSRFVCSFRAPLVNGGTSPPLVNASGKADLGPPPPSPLSVFMSLGRPRGVVPALPFRLPFCPPLFHLSIW